MIRLTLGQPDQQADRLGLTQMGYVLLHRVAGLAVVRLTEAVADHRCDLSVYPAKAAQLAIAWLVAYIAQLLGLDRFLLLDVVGQDRQLRIRLSSAC